VEHLPQFGYWRLIRSITHRREELTMIQRVTDARYKMVIQELAEESEFGALHRLLEDRLLSIARQDYSRISLENVFMVITYLFVLRCLGVPLHHGFS